MALHAIDIAVIAAYIGLTLILGFWISSRAKAGMRSYFLGGNRLPSVCARLIERLRNV